MTGIYYIKNLITSEYYIGQSIDIMKRWCQHRYQGTHHTKEEGNFPLYVSMRKYGLNNFEFKVIEECPEDELDEREKYWINYYNSYLKGYNCNTGGQKFPSIGENNPRTKLTNNDVLVIRNRIYKNNELPKDVYEDYKAIISYGAFWSLVHGVTWKNVDTSMIRSLKEIGYKNFSGGNNPKARLTKDDVYNIRYRHEVLQEAPRKIFIDYEKKISWSAFDKVIHYQTWKDIKVTCND